MTNQQLTRTHDKLKHFNRFINQICIKKIDPVFRKHLEKIEGTINDFTDFYFNSKLIFKDHDFDWDYGSDILVIAYSKYIDQWWDSDKFDWKQFAHLLPKHCSDYFNIWWSPKKYRWSFKNATLIRYCSKDFNIWWKPLYFRHNYFSVSKLIEYCPDHFEKWWQKDMFDLIHLEKPFYIEERKMSFENILKVKFKNYKHIWEPDYIIWKLHK